LDKEEEEMETQLKKKQEEERKEELPLHQEGVQPPQAQDSDVQAQAEQLQQEPLQQQEKWTANLPVEATAAAAVAPAAIHLIVH
jgi:hypothetical protein